jgi:hypothetical protein
MQEYTTIERKILFQSASQGSSDEFGLLPDEYEVLDQHRDIELPDETFSYMLAPAAPDLPPPVRPIRRRRSSIQLYFDDFARLMAYIGLIFVAWRIAA